MQSRSRGDLTIVRNVTPGYFETMRIALKRGRLLNAHDQPGANGAVVINEALARRYFPGEDPIGQTLLLRPARTIVGIVADAKNDGLIAPVMPEVVLPFPGASGSVQVALRSPGDPRQVARSLLEQLREMDPLIQANLRTMREEFQEQMSPGT